MTASVKAECNACRARVWIVGLVAAALLLACETPRSAVVQTAAPRAAVRPLPVILAPGFLGFRELGPFGAYWRGWRTALEADGFVVFEHMPTPVATSDARAADLMRTIASVKRRTGADRVIIIAHSQGGIDVRGAIARGAGEDIAAVATLSSPHRGTPLADASLALFPAPLVQVSLAGLQRVWQVENDQTFSSADADGAIASMTTASVSAAYPANVPVPVFSFAAVGGADTDGSCARALLPPPTQPGDRMPLGFIGDALITSQGPASNDGVVTTRSMRFGSFVGCVAGDHAIWLGWHPFSRFDHEAFAVELARALTDVGASNEPARFSGHVPALGAIFAAVNQSEL